MRVPFTKFLHFQCFYLLKLNLPKASELEMGLEKNQDLLATLHVFFKEPGILAELPHNSDLVFMSSLLSEGV